jgi:hypothetical protein
MPPVPGEHALGNLFVPARVYENAGLGVEFGQEGFEDLPNDLQQRFCPKRTGEYIVLFSVIARILERQNVLRTTQVLFRRICVRLAMVLPFKDSSEAAEPRCATFSAIKLPNTPRWSEARPR